MVIGLSSLMVRGMECLVVVSLEWKDLFELVRVLELT